MKKLLVLVTILSTLAISAYAGSHSKKAKGDITKADYLKQAEARFDRMDANKDGILTAAEKKAYSAKLKAARDAKKSKEGTKPQTK